MTDESLSMPVEFTPDPRDPYRIDAPALVSVSGGRTSGFMLAKIIDAFGGSLPPDVIPVFCNTGREHEATLQFLKEIGSRWTPIVWLEYRYRPSTGRVHDFEVVDYCSASRNGEPFSQLIVAKKMLPNPVTRFCTSELKIRTGNRYAKSLGWDSWSRVVGLRADEPRRVAKIHGDGAAENAVCPMAEAGHTLADVSAFWASQHFDLELPGNDHAFGNCDLCFLKGRSRIEKVMRTMPESARWWTEQERGGNRFRNDRPTYGQMSAQLTVQGRLLDDAIDDDTMPCMCHD